MHAFYDAYVQSDLLGKGIFIALIALSIVSWVLLIQKVWLTQCVRKYSHSFYNSFQKYKYNPLGMEKEKRNSLNSFLEIYLVLKKYTLEVLNKNRRFSQQYTYDEDTPSYLSPSDIDFVESHLISVVANQTKNLERNLFILATVVSLAPFLGLLGTVWGILNSFSHMQSQAAGSTNQMVLGGLSLALATTVLGLIDAIPALIGYNFLKNRIRDFETEMQTFSNEVLAAVEMQYRKVDVK